MEFPAAPRSQTKRICIELLALSCWGYLLLLIGMILYVRQAGDVTSRGTLLLFSPRWVVLLPMAVLIPLAAWLRRRLLFLLLIAGAVAILPFMGFVIGPHHFIKASTPGFPIRILAYNLHNDPMNEPAFAQFFKETHPDIVCMEELHENFNRRLFPRNGWHMVRHGEICLASRYPIISARDPWENCIAAFAVLTPAGRADLLGVHLSSPHYALKDAITGEENADAMLIRNIKNRGIQSSLLQQQVAACRGPLLITGDFNLLPDSTLLLGKFPTMTDCFESTGLGFGWTYTNSWTEVRIDRVLSNSFFTPVAFHRGPKFLSPHLPIIADLILHAH